MASPPRLQTIDVEIPEGAGSGDTIEIVTSEGITVKFVVPEGVGPGAVLTVEVPQQEIDNATATAADDEPPALPSGGVGVGGGGHAGARARLYAGLLTPVSAQAAEAAAAADWKNAAKMGDWAAAKLAAFDADGGVRSKREKQYGSRAGYAAFLSHRSQHGLAEARRAKSTLDHAAGLQPPPGMELHDVPDFGRVLIATRDYGRHDVLFREKAVLLQPLGRAVSMQLWADQVSAVDRLPEDVQQAVLGLPQAETLAVPGAPTLLQPAMGRLGADAARAVPLIVTARSFWVDKQCALFAVASHLPHSCDGSVTVSGVPGDGSLFEMRALRPIQRGEVLTADYFAQPKFVGTVQRRTELMSLRKIRCNCTRCARPDTTSALPCPTCNPAEKDGQKVKKATSGYILRHRDGSSVCDVCGSSFARADIEQHFFWEQQATKLVSCIATEVKAGGVGGVKNLGERLRGMYYAIVKLVGWRHWTVCMVRLMQLRAAMGSPDVRASDIATLLSSLFEWFYQVGLDPVRFIGPESVTAAALSLRKSASPLPMVAVQYYTAALNATPPYLERHLELSQALELCHAESKAHSAEAMAMEVNDARVAKLMSIKFDEAEDHEDKEATTQDSDDDIKEVHNRASEVKNDGPNLVAVSCDESESLGKHAMQQANETGLIDYIQRCFRECSSAEDLAKMQGKLRQVVHSTGISGHTSMFADSKHEANTAFWDARETLKLDGDDVSYTNNGLSESQPDPYSAMADMAKKAAAMMQKSEDAVLNAGAGRRERMAKMVSTHVDQAIDLGQLSIAGWLKQCCCTASAPAALSDFVAVADVALLCSERDDLVFLGVSETEAETLWDSIRSIALD